MDNREALIDRDAVIVTTEMREGLTSRVFLLVFFNALSCPVTVLSYFGPRHMDWDVVVLLVLWHALFLTLTLVVFPLLLGPRGTWVIGLEGIAFHPCAGASWWMEWSAIERLRWDARLVRLRGGGTTITLSSQGLTGPQFGRARDRNGKMLATDFDLEEARAGSEGPASPEPWWAKPIGIACGMATVFWAAIAVALAARFPGRSEGWVLQGWVGSPLAFVYAYLLLDLVRRHRALKRAHPTWPWRSRRSPGAPALAGPKLVGHIRDAIT